MDTQFDESDLDCMFYTCTTFFAHRWQLSILMYLFTGPKHFGEILRYHKGLSKKVLASILKRWNRKGLFQKQPTTKALFNAQGMNLPNEGLSLSLFLMRFVRGGENIRLQSLNRTSLKQNKIPPNCLIQLGGDTQF